MASAPPVQPATERHGTPSGVLDRASGMLEEARSVRRDLHRWPEVGLDLPKTRDRVLEALDGLPLDVTLHTTTSGIAALLTGDKPGPTVMLRLPGWSLLGSAQREPPHVRTGEVYHPMSTKGIG